MTEWKSEGKSFLCFVLFLLRCGVFVYSNGSVLFRLPYSSTPWLAKLFFDVQFSLGCDRQVWNLRPQPISSGVWPSLNPLSYPSYLWWWWWLLLSSLYARNPRGWLRISCEDFVIQFCSSFRESYVHIPFHSLETIPFKISIFSQWYLKTILFEQHKKGNWQSIFELVGSQSNHMSQGSSSKLSRLVSALGLVHRA